MDVTRSTRRSRKGLTSSSATISLESLDGTRVEPEYGSVFISMNGPDRTSARTDLTIAVPSATARIVTPDH
jgi:hypothetical protein